MKSDIEIARAARKLPIQEIGARLGIPERALLPYGRDKAKVEAEFVEATAGRDPGHLILVTAITPTPAGEGKTTTAVGLGDALNRIGRKTAICLREPSLGPCFGMKGGAAGGGYAQVVPMEEINLHFTGDFHAIGAAHNLLAALIDNHIHWGNAQRIDPRRVAWRRVLDLNDRALRQIVCALGGAANGFPRESGFDITVASEVMAILCLTENASDFRRRLGDITIGARDDGSLVSCRDVKADGAMAALLQQALLPNLVQTLENNPAFIHGGPFANIAHGCNSVIATRTALGLADCVVTEAGFGADLGAEKFFNIKCRKAGLKPGAVALVATVRALKMHGGAAPERLHEEDLAALKKGCANLGRHIANIKQFGVPLVVAINHFAADAAAEVEQIKAYAAEQGVEAVVCRHWAQGSEGALELAEKAAALLDRGGAQFAPLYKDDMPLFEKIRAVARRIYRADDVAADKKVRAQLKEWDALGFGALPVCIAKTQYSFSTDPNLRGAPTGHIMPIREVRLSTGAGFVIVIAGAILTMPGLPRKPSAENIYPDEKGRIEGLF